MSRDPVAGDSHGDEALVEIKLDQHMIPPPAVSAAAAVAAAG
eukprot:CAMPEP_0172178486 /NCGR_PEP_ID=MMETSP1050-20130122/16067_1 /TAXON_ID=233186 /ORGANISM="Cryptomonas curvata, Strain CCAP979/52" /LENGTH=41 /DNA_ID= /DNA_START= /DNA_END= /DNA_ORIENTATION=